MKGRLYTCVYELLRTKVLRSSKNKLSFSSVHNAMNVKKKPEKKKKEKNICHIQFLN